MSRNGWTIELNHICFERNKLLILDEISLKISNNDIILMTGQNGSGKSTLLRIISGLLKPNAAEIRIDYIEQNWLQARNILRQRFCYLHQQPYLFHGTVFDNVAYGLRRKKLSSKEIKDQVNHALQTFSLGNLANRDCSKLSGGEKQRVAIVRSWIIKPDIILLDEPFANMDKESRFKFFELINQLSQDNIAVLFTSHDPQKGELEFNQHLHLYQGQMIVKPVGNKIEI